MGKRALGLLVLSCAIAGSVGAGTSGAACPIDNPDCGVGGGGGTVFYTLSVSRSQGSVTSSPTGISCPTDCTQSYAEGTAVTLTASSGPSGDTPDWTGCDSVSSGQCHVTMNSAASVSLAWLDAMAPSVSLTAPGAGYKAGTIPLSATASDNAAVSRVDFFVRGVLRATDSNAPYSTSFDTTTLSDGTAAVVARAYDTSNNLTDSGPVSITIDNTHPTVGVTGPNNETFAPGSTQTWSITSSDATSGVSSVKCSVVPHGQLASFGSCSGGNSSHSVSDEPVGSYYFTVRATDAAGNTRDVTRSFTIAAPSSLGGSQQQGSGNQQGGSSGGSNVGASISDAVLASKIVSDLGSAAKKLAKQKEHSLAKKGKYSLSLHSLMAGKFTASFTGAAGKARASKTTKIATGSKQATGAGTYKLTLKLTKAGKKLLRKGKRVKGSLTVTFTKPGGGKVSRHKTVTLKRR